MIKSCTAEKICLFSSTDKSVLPYKITSKVGWQNVETVFKSSCHKFKPEDHWYCIAHLSAEDPLKSAVMEEKKFKILNLFELDQGQWITLTFGTHKASCTHFSWLHVPTFITDYNSLKNPLF